MSDRDQERETLTIAKPDDFHVHFRQGEAMEAYVRRHGLYFGRAMAMPNTVPPVADGESLRRYAEALGAPARASGLGIMTAFKLLPGMSRRTVEECARAGALAGKYYPSGATTNAEDGPSSPEAVAEALDAMQELGIPLSIHGEDPGADSLKREAAFLPVVERILAKWPQLKVTLEHLSTSEAAGFVLGGPERLGATVTAHHLLFTLDDMLGSGLDPHLFCKPILKSKADRTALREAVATGSRIFFGSDSAPHPKARKESGSAPGGVYSTPTSVPALVELFERMDASETLVPFLAERGADFYGLPRQKGSLSLVREPWIVPGVMDGCVPMCAGMTLQWSLA